MTNSDLNPENANAIVAANRIARREELLRTAAGDPKWKRYALGLLGVGTMGYIVWTWDRPWGLAAMLLLVFVQQVDFAASRRLDAIVHLLEEDSN